MTYDPVIDIIDSYTDKFLRRHLNFEINDKLYPQIIQTYITSDNQSKNISKAFKADKIEPMKYLSSKLFSLAYFYCPFFS
jgi:hypothetical protein